MIELDVNECLMFGECILHARKRQCIVKNTLLGVFVCGPFYHVAFKTSVHIAFSTCTKLKIWEWFFLCIWSILAQWRWIPSLCLAHGRAQFVRWPFDIMQCLMRVVQFFTARLKLVCVNMGRVKHYYEISSLCAPKMNLKLWNMILCKCS